MSWSARLLVGLVLIILGAAAATWALAHYQPAARFLGVANPPAAPPPQSRPRLPRLPAADRAHRRRSSRACPS